MSAPRRRRGDEDEDLSEGEEHGLKNSSIE